jgi:hypothetical protein
LSIRNELTTSQDERPTPPTASAGTSAARQDPVTITLWNNGDLILIPKPSNPRLTIHLLVSSENVARASPVFAMLLKRSMAEAQVFKNTSVPYELSLPDDDSRAVEHIMRIIHYRPIDKHRHWSIELRQSSCTATNMTVSSSLSPGFCIGCPLMRLSVSLVVSSSGVLLLWARDCSSRTACVTRKGSQLSPKWSFDTFFQGIQKRGAPMIYWRRFLQQ